MSSPILFVVARGLNMFSLASPILAVQPHRQNGGMGLSVAMSSESLLELAKSRMPADRERLLLGIVELCDAGDGEAAMVSPQIQALLNSIFLGLVAGAEREIRKRLADKLSTV